MNNDLKQIDPITEIEKDDEIWVEVWDFPTYEVSNKGNIRHAKKQKRLKVRQDGREYRMVCIWYNKKRYTKRLGRLVWTSFNKCNCDLSIHHINGNAGDDRLENLTCIPILDNIRERKDFKRKNKYQLTPHDKGYIHKSITDKLETTWTIMKKYGIPLNYIQTVMKRGSWKKYSQ